MRFVLSGGGTAGHINPALALAEVLQERGHEVFFAGTPQGVEGRLVADAHIPFTAFKASGINRKRPLSALSALTNMIKSTASAKRWLEEIKPDAVVGFGGYVCIPVGRAAKKLHIPLVLHEQNSVMGLANKYLSKAAKVLALTYEVSASSIATQKKSIVTGNPVRKAVINATRAQGRSLLDIADDALVLLVFGGSLGARHINCAVAGLKDRLLEKENLVIVQITGPKEYDAVAESLALSDQERTRWKLFSYQDKMGEVLAACDIVLARAGATSLAEIAARHIPALLVPYPYATEDHQTTNALAYVESGAADMVADADLDTKVFAEKLFALIESDMLRSNMKNIAANLEAEDAAARLADVVLAATRP